MAGNRARACTSVHIDFSLSYFRMSPSDTFSAESKTADLMVAGPEVLALNHESRILGQVRLCAVWPKENWHGSSLNQIQGWTTIQQSYSRALEQGHLWEGAFKTIRHSYLPLFYQEGVATNDRRNTLGRRDKNNLPLTLQHAYRLPHTDYQAEGRGWNWSGTSDRYQKKRAMNVQCVVGRLPKDFSRGCQD